MRYSEAVRAAIYEKYCPTVEGGKDPDVLWVGPFLDGLQWLLPELFARSEGQNIRNLPVLPGGRRGIKLFFMDVGRDASAEAGDVVAGVVMQRADWGVDAEGQVKRLLFRKDRMIDEEPGELLNALTVVADLETGAQRLVNPTTGEPAEPFIREEKRFGLHYLKRGDFFKFEWITRRKRYVAREFRLRPPTEGSSELQVEQRTDIAVF